MSERSIRLTSELERIIAIPRRSITPEQWADIAEQLTAVLKTPGGAQKLFPIQAMALHDIGTTGAGFLPIGVGCGKTLISLLAPYVLNAKRPLLLLPAALISKTLREIPKYAKHWRIHPDIRLFSYEMLGRVQASAELESYNPDLLLGDEIHKLKNKKAAVTRRVARFMHDHPGTSFIGMSGTMMRRGVEDFATILRWCLKGNAPVPKSEHETEEWAQALDDKVTDEARFEPGALLRLCTHEEITSDEGLRNPVTIARRGFQRRLTETPGVVASAGNGSESVSCSIYVKAVLYEMKPITNAHFHKLRNTWMTPDDWTLYQATDVWRHARELSLGLHYVWDPRPPQPWRDARRDWHAFVRETLSRSRTLDSELAVANACDAGTLPGEALQAWREIRNTFIPNTVAIWHDDTVLKLAAEWMKKPGIVWTSHAHFARRLAQMTGARYYGAEGYTDDGAHFIEDAQLGDVAIDSVNANREGRNLQAIWNRNLLIGPPNGADALQQLIGRTHRTGQLADEVSFDILLGCREHAQAWRKAMAGALAIRDTLGEEQKILLSDIEWPTEDEIGAFPGPRWAVTEEEIASASADK